MTVADAPLVPPARLAALLAARRHEMGLGHVELAQRSRGAFSPSYLASVERGAVSIGEHGLSQLVDLYEIEAGPLIPDRSKLILDLEAQRMSVGPTAVPFQGSTAEEVFERYVSLLYLLRDERPGRLLTLRDDDLDVLGSAFGHSRDRLRDELIAVMSAAQTATTSSALARRLSIGAAGLLVGCTAAGSLVLVGSGSSGPGAPVAAGERPAAALIGLTQGQTNPAASGDVMQGTVRPDSPARLRIDSISPSASLAGTSLPAAADGGSVALVSAVSSLQPALDVVPDALTRNTDPNPSELTQLQRIEAHLGFDIASLAPGWTVIFDGPSTSHEGITSRVQRTITLFVDDDATIEHVSEVLMHEVGHTIDLDRLTDEQRHAWIALRGMPSVWWAGNGLTDFAVGAGDFAEAVSAYTTGSASHSVYGDFTPEQIEFVAAIVG